MYLLKLLLFAILEFDALKRLGIDDPVVYIKNHYGNSDVTLLNSCCIGYTIQTQIIAAIEEAKTSHSWVDVMVCVCVCVSVSVSVSVCACQCVCVHARVHLCMWVCVSCSCCGVKTKLLLYL